MNTDAIDAQFRTTELLPFAVALLAVVVCGPKVIASLRRLKYGQTVNTDAPRSHAEKQGTPTMGGVLFLIGVAIAVPVACVVFSEKLYGVQAGPFVSTLLVFLMSMGLGFLDDYLSITRGKNLGLKARFKFAGQFAIAAVFMLSLWFIQPAESSTVQMMIVPGQLLYVNKILYDVVAGLLMVFMSNATNLTDGLDGLAAGLSVLVFGALATMSGFNCPNVAIVAAALAGGCLGFLVYNGKPASVFMGDTGSLSLGATMTAIAVFSHLEAPFLVLAGVFVVEGLSVMLQVASFKATGKRIFKMAPLHHHFELLGWPETQVVMRFWIVGVLLFLLGLWYATGFVTTLSNGI